MLDGAVDGFQERAGSLGRVLGRSDGWKDWKSGRSGAAKQRKDLQRSLHGQVDQPKTKGLKLMGELSKDKDDEVLETFGSKISRYWVFFKEQVS